MEDFKKLGGCFMMCGMTGPVIDVKLYPETLKRIFVHLMILIDDLLRGYPFLPCLNGNGDTVFVRSADEYNVLSFQPQVAGINVRRHIDTGQVSDMHRAIGIGKSGSNEISFVIFHEEQR
jgi:hypothetical protein